LIFFLFTLQGISEHIVRRTRKSIHIVRHNIHLDRSEDLLKITITVKFIARIIHALMNTHN